MRGALLAILVLLALAAACAVPVRAPVEAPAAGPPAAFPGDFYLRAAARGERVYRFAPERSQAVMYAYSAGKLARLGHDHVIVSRDVRGYVFLPAAGATGRADLYVRLPSLSVDEPPLRAQAGFTTEPSTADIAGTRRNMLDKVLEADVHPFALLHIEQLRAGPTTPVLAVALSLHGVTRTLRIPVEVEHTGDELGVAGAFSLLQTDFGIAPYSLLGGALQVDDRVDVRFRLRATRIPTSAESLLAP